MHICWKNNCNHYTGMKLLSIQFIMHIFCKHNWIIKFIIHYTSLGTYLDLAAYSKLNYVLGIVF